MDRGRRASAVAENSTSVVENALSKAGCKTGKAKSNVNGAAQLSCEFGSALPTAVLAAVLKKLVREACGSDTGTTKLPSGDVAINSNAELTCAPFSSVIHCPNVKFEELRGDNAAVSAVAEMTYLRFFQKQADLRVIIVVDFPPCLCPSQGQRYDLAIAGHVLVSLCASSSGPGTARIFADGIDNTLGKTCSSDFLNSALPEEWRRLSNEDVERLPDLLEDAQLAISTYWNDSTQDTQARFRTEFLLTLVGTQLLDYFSKHAEKSGNLFRGEKRLADSALSCCDEWIGICARLTKIDWAGTWSSPFEDPALLKVRNRLSAVSGYRGLIDEITELLPAREQRSLRVDTLWDVFDHVDILDPSPSTESQWKSAEATLRRRLEPVEHQCASLLKNFFATRAALAPQAILADFSNYRQLLKRSVVSKELVSERDSLLARLNERLQSIRLEFEHRADSVEDEAILEYEDRQCQTGRFLPGVVNNVIWLQQLRSKVEDMEQMSKTLLSDLAPAADFAGEARKLLGEIEDYEQDTVKNWIMDVKDQKGTLTLDANSPLMEIDGNGRVEVNYPERLVQLIREVRVFSALGIRVPTDIQKIAKQGLQFYQSGVALKQVAETYNSMQKDIIPCTQAMLLEPAVRFEGVVAAGGDRKFTWKNSTDSERFIEQLRNASHSLTDDNRRLGRLHDEIGTIVRELFDVDLLRNKERWMGRVHAIRDKMEGSGFRNMEAWKRYWDMQLYKALEYQYQLGLECLHEVVEEIKADIVYDAATGRAALRPSIEVIREQYYYRIRDFLTFPLKFQGCGETEMFKSMPGYNEQGIFSVLRHASQLFKKVSQELKRLSPLLVIGLCGRSGAPTLEAIVGEALTEVQQWEQNIRLLKQKGKEINGVELFIKIDCITLCTAGVKSAVEEHLFKLADALNVTLRKSAEKHLTRIDAYLEKVSESLDAKLTKLDEIGQANLVHAQLVEQRPSVEVEMHNFYNKNKLLQSTTNTRGIEFAKTKKNWDYLIGRLDSHEKEMEEQLNKMRSAVDTSLKTWMKDLERFTNQWHELKPKSIGSTNATKFVGERKEQFAELKARGEEVVKQCAFFQLDEPDLQPMEDVETDINEYWSMWAKLDEFQEDLAKLKEEPWITLRSKLYRFDDFVVLWQEKLKELPNNPITVHIRSTLNEWGRCTPTLKFVRGDGFTPLHWNEMFALLGLRSVTQDTLTFGQILDKYENVLKNEVDLKKLHARAQGEAQIREALDDVRSWGSEAKLVLVPHADRKGVMLVTDWKDTLNALSDNQALLLSVKDSPFFTAFASDANQWETRLAVLDEYLHHMNQIQRKWVYLEPIFRRGALPEERERFNSLDRQYLAIMSGIAKDPRLLDLVSHTEYKDKLGGILEQLDRCQKSLNEFLETKRDRFSRFYFISDDDLLEILAQSKNPAVIQQHLKKLFMGIHSVGFDSQKENILQMRSAEGEAVPLESAVRVTDEVEEWLTALDEEMKRTVSAQLVRCVEHLDIGAYPSQVLCTAAMITFTRKTEEAIRESRSGALRQHRANLQAQLKDLTSFAAKNNDHVIDLKVKALIMDLIHNIEVVGLLDKENVDTEASWLWRKQLRYYLDKKGSCVLRMVDAEFKYTYEYQGNAPKLVHTPLTDRCYLTLTQGMQLGYGGNPYGPAGTGKTESVKALGNAMGRQVLVFNCDEGIDFKSMGRIFAGLVKCGAWGCFDEFNRLKIDQLSAISQMIQVIQESLKNGDTHCPLLEKDVEVNPSAGIFVTLNPAGKGYGGRTKLPDNLKQLFRSVAMSAPDDELIAETILLSEGFVNASEIARKTVEIFRLSKQLLSRQQHYDWGLRAIKAVLRLGGTLIHQFSSDRVAHGKNLSEAEVLAAESEIIIQSLRVNTLSKLTFDDAVLFNGLVSDVFPDVAIREVSYEELRPALHESVKDLGLQLMPAQVEKALQLYEALRQRMGVVLVGPSGSGKSTLLHLLRKAMQRLGVSVPLYAMNPKAMPRTQLLGHMDSDTREWYEGVLTEAAKKVVREESEVRSWILCDGDIDPEWIESLNSVLDDNKLLTMPNGVRIQFGSNVNFLFETHSLESASPATVSRMGIIYLSEEDVDPRMAVASWLQEQPEESRAKLQKWINDYFYSAIDSLLVTGALVVETTRTGLVMSGLSQLSGCATKEQFTMGLIYGLGSYLAETHRKDYAKDVLYLVGERAPDPKAPLDFYYDTQRGMYKVFEFEPSLDLTVDDLRRQPMVRTVDCQRNMTIMQAWTQPVKPGVYRPFVLVGPEGCGKSMLLSNLFRNVSSARVATVNCAAHTVASHVIQKLKQTCQLFNTNKGRVLRPKEAERLVLLLKDLNLPKPDKYGTVQLHSFLQQLILYNGFYDNDLEWVNVERVQVVGSMSPPGSMGRYPVSSRFLAIVSVLSISYPSSESLQKVYTDFLNVMFQSQRASAPSQTGSGHGPASSSGTAPKSAAEVARVMTAIYQSVVAKYTVDDASHYVFNPRDLTNWTLNIMNYTTTDMGDSIAHECRRIFIDRLISSDDRTKVTKVMQDNMTSFVGHGNSCIADKETDFYVSWLDSSSGVGKKKLTLASAEDVKNSSQLGQLHYSREYADLDLQLIPETCAWIARIDRILSQERGNALLVARSGMGGSGIIRLVSFLCRMDVITPGITREYTVKQFNAEVKQAMVKAGVEGLHVTFLLEEHQLVHASFLETINSLLSSGEVPGLFTHEELDAMLNPLREDALGEGMSTYEYFVDRVSRFLHVCVVMDPTDRSYEMRCRANPALFTRCSVCWMGTWTSDSLKVVPRLVMKDVYSALDGRDDKKNFSLTSELVHMHRSMGDKFSPKHFKILCETYTHLFTTKRDSVSEGLERLKGGLSKLAEAQESVDKISHDVTEKKTLMEAKQKEADDALTEIQVSMEESGEQKKSIQKIQKELSKEQKAVEERKAVIQERLGGIQPTLDSARSSVNSIRPEHLSELKSMKQPPAAVQDVMEAVILLISGGAGAGGADTNWASIRKVLAGDIKGQILGYDIDNVSDTLRSKVEKYMSTKAASFKREVIERASKAAAPMCQWLLAVIEYSKVLETVAPMRSELQEYEANLEKGRNKKTKYEGKLGKVEEKIEELKAKFGDKTKEAERLKTKVEKAEKLLQNASDLLAKLSGEKVRWKSQAKAIASEMDLLPRRALMAAAFIVYLGREPEDVRRVKVDEWMERQKTTDFNFFTFLRSESVQLKYKAQGLPGDQLSMDNAVLILEQVTIPLIEDPAGQAVAWLSSNLRDSTGKQSSFEMCSISDERLVSTLELALRFGKTLVITDVDNLEPFMYPLFRKELRNEGTKKVLQIGDRRSVDYGDSFRLFLVTRQHNMYIPPDVVSYVTPVSFSVTQSGLEGQFLGITIQHEQPELEQQKTEVLAKEESLKLQLAELEESLLSELANSEGSLLENTKLIESLNDIKSSASEIEAALATSKEVQEQLDLKRNVYRPFAATGSEVFFLVKSLKALCHMYQFSLNMFIDRYREALRLHKDDRTDIDSKISALKVTFVQLIVKSVTDALFKEHRTTFGVHLTRCLFKAEFCSDIEWSLFIDSAVVADTKKSEVRVPTWVLESSKDSFRSLAVLLPDIVATQNFQEADVWLQWMRTSTPEKDYPSYFSKVTPFQQLLIIKTLRPDRLVAAMNHLACEMLHVNTLNDSSTLPSLVDSMKPDIPMLLITTSGADPSMELQTLAYERVGRDQFHQVAMGGGQTDHALQLLKECAESGHWIFLKNLHLVIPWVGTLQKELNLLTPHKNFRLFLTTESHDEFPSILLSQSLKVTFEAPPGVKQNLLRTYKNWGAKRYEAKGNLHTQLLFITAWMHAILQERLSYVPQGWTQMYEFTVADLKAASDIVEQQSSNNGDVDWRSIHGILDSAIYGGRMESDFDVRILRTYLNRFFRPETLATAKKQRALHGKIKVIGTGKFADITELIDNLPDSDVPALFSLPPNSDRVVQLARVRRTVEDLQRLHEAKEASQLTREEWAARLEPLLNSWAELTQPHSDLLTHGTTSRREAKPMEAFVNAEVAAALGLVQRVETTMNELRRVLDGTLLLTEDRRGEAAAMILGEVPPHWDTAFTGPSRILPWLQSLLFRATTVVQWQGLCMSGSLLKTPLKLAGILRPKTFLNVLRQETAHSTHEALVSLKLSSKVGSPPDNTVMCACLSGLLLQGAVLDDNRVLKQIESADSPGFFSLPDIYVGWTTKVAQNDTIVSVPVYSSATKENYLLALDLGCDSAVAADELILSGVAIMLEQ